MPKKKHLKTEVDKKFNFVAITVLIAIIGFTIYSNTFYSSFAYDDHSAIIENQQIKNSSIYTQFNIPRYVGLVSFALNYHFNQLNTFGYHLVNFLIHILNTLLVYSVTKTIMLIYKNQYNCAFRREIPLFTALIFLAHPVQTQAVTYIVQRFTSLSALFALVTIFFYLKFRSSEKKHYTFFILSLIAAVLAFKTKENTATIPILIIAIEAILFRQQKILKERILYVLPYFLLVAVIPLSIISTNQTTGTALGEITTISYETTNITRTDYFLTEMRVITTYIRLLVLPVKQSVDYYYPLSKSFFEISTFLAFCFLTSLLLLALFFIKKQPFITLGIAWFFIFLPVESSIIPIRDVIYEHRIYLPSIGFINAFVYSLFLIEEKINWKKFAFLLSGAIVLVLAVCTYQRNTIWDNEIALWSDAAAKFPQNARAFENLGTAYMYKKLYTNAIDTLQKAIALDSTISSQWYNLAWCHKAIGLTDDAIKEYTIALELSPQYKKAAINLATIYIQKGEPDKAYEVLIKIKNSHYPKDPYINALIAQAHCDSGKIKTAIVLFEQAISMGLNYPDMYYNFAACLMKQGATKESRNYFLKTIEFNPQETESYYFIAVTYDAENNFDKAIEYYKIFLSRATNSPWLETAHQRIQALMPADTLR